MACDESALIDYLKVWDNPTAPVDAVVCPFTSDAGAGMATPLFVLVVAMGLGVGLSIRAQHPGPVLAAFMLSAGFFATRLPGGGARVLVIVLLFGVAAAGYVIYRSTSQSLGQ